MTVTVTVEDGTIVADANSYVSVETARAYFAPVPAAAAFLDLSDDEIGGYLVWSTRVLDQKTMWKGCEVKPGVQVLDWPRLGAVDKYGYCIASDVVPPQVIAVTCELANWLLTNNPADGSDVSNLKQITVDVIEIVFQDATSQTNWPTIFNQIIAGLGQLKVGGRGFGRVVKA